MSKRSNTKPPRAQCVRLPIHTTAGVFVASYTPKGLARLEFPPPRKIRNSLEAIALLPADKLRQWHRAATSALRAVIRGTRPRSTVPPMDLSRGTVFQRQVWRTLRRIPLGSTKSYSAIASMIGNPKATRAVGTACGANPIPLLVPCHRVLAANGRIGGYSGGLEWKRDLLAREGVQVAG